MFKVAKAPDATYQFSKITTYYMIVLTIALFTISIFSDTIISIFAAREYFGANNRTVFINRNLEKMSAEKLKNHIEIAQKFLQKL